MCANDIILPSISKGRKHDCLKILNLHKKSQQQSIKNIFTRMREDSRYENILRDLEN